MDKEILNQAVMALIGFGFLYLFFLWGRYIKKLSRSTRMHPIILGIIVMVAIGIATYLTNGLICDSKTASIVTSEIVFGLGLLNAREGNTVKA